MRISHARQAFATGAVLALAGCVVQGSPPPLKGSGSVSIDGGAVAVNQAEVPVLSGVDGGAMTCSAGQLVGMGANGWECVTPAGISAGTGIQVENNVISADFGTSHSQVAYGDHLHDDRYRKLADPITWGDFDSTSIPMTADWPGEIKWEQITDAPVVTWGTISDTVSSMTNWPGLVPFGQITGVPAITWSTISGTVTTTTDWPGTIPFSQVTGVPATTWSTISSTVTSSTEWPGTVPYDRVTGAPVVTWDTVSGSVGSTTIWPGEITYEQITDPPAPATWTSISGTVGGTTDWPGTIPYAKVTGTPTPATWSSISGTIPGGTNWPGNVPYAEVTGVPSLNVTGSGAVTVSGSPVSLGGTVSIGLQGAVGVSNGGTGAISINPGVVVSTNSAGPLSSVAPGAAGNVLTSTGSGWVSQPISTTGVAHISTATTTLYVSTSGSDTACNGTADAPAGSGNCAFATPQHAIDSLPQVLLNPVTIQIDAGTYYDTSGLTTLLDLRKSLQKAGGTITITGGGGGAILSGLASSGASSPSASIGILVAYATGSTAATPIAPVIINNITVQNVSATGIDVETSKVELNAVTVSSTGQDGILCEGSSYCEFLGSVLVFGAVGAGVHARYGSWLDVEGTLTANSNGNSQHLSPGILLEQSSTMTANGAVTSSNNEGPGLVVEFASNVSLTQPATFNNNLGALAGAQQPAATSVLVAHSSVLNSTNGVSITTANGVNGITSDRNATVALLPPSGATGNVTVTCGTTATGFVVTHSSSIETGGSGGVTLASCTNGVVLNWHGSFIDDGGSGCGARSISGAVNNVTGDGWSVFTAGCFSSSLCTPTSHLECD